ncbi:MAG: HD domain-containing phosphohydrolase [Pirellulaceae bacterium]
MNLRNRWLIVVLICGVQLIAGLGMVSYEIDRFEERTVAFLGNQSTAETTLIIEDLVSKLPDQSIRSFECTQHLRGMIEASRVTENRVFCFYDGEADSLSDCRQPLGAAELSSDSLLITDLESKESVSLADCIADPLMKTCVGEIRLANQSYFATIFRMPGTKNAIVGAQSEKEVLSDFLIWMRSARNVCFTGVLLLGFITIFLTTNILQKFETRLSKFHSQLQNMVEKRTAELGKTKNGVIFGLAKLAESRDNDTGEHLDRIRSYVTILSNELKTTHREIDDQFIQNIGLASSLHDIGKVGIPDAVLLKPGRLTDLERKIMQFHTTIGHECLEAIEDRIGSDEFLKMACDIARFHHERWDGAGYPDGVSGEKIPLAARIVSVADVYDALTSRRPYKEPMTHEKSSQIIREGSGTQFDPEIIEAFERTNGRFLTVMKNCHSQQDDEAIIPAIARLQQALQDGASNEVLV